MSSPVWVFLWFVIGWTIVDLLRFGKRLSDGEKIDFNMRTRLIAEAIILLALASVA